MFDYAVRRLLLMIVTLFLGSIILFVSMRTLPPEDAIERRLTPEARQQCPECADEQRRLLGIYGPLHKQYIRWATGFREYYDLRRDPFQEHNALAPRADLANHRGRPVGRQSKVTVVRSAARRKAASMHAALNRVAHCAGRACP
jgi:hypothetical protein